MPTPDTFVQLGLAGGFVFSSVVLTATLWMLFKAWRDGALVSRSVHKDVVENGLNREKRLEEVNDRLRHLVEEQSREIARMAAAYERLSEQRSRRS